MTTAKGKTAAGSSSSTTTPSPEAGERLLNKDGSRRKSRVLRRKTDHSIIERRRREKINEKLVALQNLVPACRKECQDLIDRKYAAPVAASDNLDAQDGSTSKRSAKRKREEEKLEKAKAEMSDKVRSSMVLEKLCIISHTLDFVIRLQEENKTLKAICDCRFERRASPNSEVELEEHYRSAHSYDGSVPQTLPLTASQTREEIDERASSSSSSLVSDSGTQDEDAEMAARSASTQTGSERPTKRRLHWGSDDIREACIRSGTCHHVREVVSHSVPYHEDHSSSLTCDFATQSRSSDEIVQQDVKRPSCASASVACDSFCRTRHSCCRDEDGSETFSDVSDELPSPPPFPAARSTVSISDHADYLRRQRLPSITHLGLPKQDSQSPSLRHDAFTSLYRRDLPRGSAVASSRTFRPLSLYTSHVPRPHVASIKPQ